MIKIKRGKWIHISKYQDSLYLDGEEVKAISTKPNIVILDFIKRPDQDGIWLLIDEKSKFVENTDGK